MLVWTPVARTPSKRIFVTLVSVIVVKFGRFSVSRKAEALVVRNPLRFVAGTRPIPIGFPSFWSLLRGY